MPFDFFIKVLRLIERTTGNTVKTLRTDRGKEFCNTEFDLLLEREGIMRETSTSYTHQQNGYVERDNRTICEAARSMLHLHDLPLTLWAEATNTAVYLLNRTINTQVGLVTPYELWFKKKPTVSHYRTFGTIAYTFIDKSQRTKFQPKGNMVVFVGYSATSKGWRFWNPTTKSILESSDAIFDESTGYAPSLFSSMSQTPVDIPPSLSDLHVPAPPIPPLAPIPPQLVPILPPVGVSSTTDSISPLHDNSSDNSSHSSDTSSCHPPIPPVSSPSSPSSDPYAFDIPYPS